MDVGEADRFCVVLTRAHGRLAARARSVRKPGSRMGGVLLPFSHARLEFAESSAGFMVVGASNAEGDPLGSAQLKPFSHLQRGVELLLQLTEEGEAMPQIFDLTLTFFHASHLEGCEPVAAYTLALLSLLGHLPETADDARFQRVSAEGRAYIMRAIKQRDIDVLCEQVPEGAGVERFIEMVLAEVLQRPLKATHIL